MSNRLENWRKRKKKEGRFVLGLTGFKEGIRKSKLFLSVFLFLSIKNPDLI
jgi:hypothetical protein